MNGACPLCGGDDHRVVRRASVPPTIFAVDGEHPGRFAELELARCTGCGHLHNRAFDPSLLPGMYDAAPLTNMPVHPSMMDRLRSLTDWLDMPAYQGRRVVEIGSGAGHLARILAQWADRVTLYEPNRGLDRSLVPESNVDIRNEPFPLDGSAAPADLIVCRQVVEHATDPAAMLGAIRRALPRGGAAYVEIPSGDHLEARAALADIHLQHVQYFHEANFVALAARTGLRAMRRLSIKDGHDVGFLFAAADPAPVPFAAAPAPETDRLGGRLEARAAAAQAAARAWPDATALYGATAHGQALLNALDGARRFDVVFDDNPHVERLGLYDRWHVVPAAAPDARALSRVEAVVVTAYLHDEAIARRLREVGFAGLIITSRPDAAEAPVDASLDVRPLWPPESEAPEVRS